MIDRRGATADISHCSQLNVRFSYDILQYCLRVT